MSITNLAALQTLNGQPIKSGKEVSFSAWNLTSVDALVAFLVKFNPGVESIDCSKNSITRESRANFSRISTTGFVLTSSAVLYTFQRAARYVGVKEPNSTECMRK